MSVIVKPDIDLYPVDLPGELLLAIVGGHRRTELVSDIHGLVGGEEECLRALDSATPGGFAVDVERHFAPLGDSSAVVGELCPDLMMPRRDLTIAFDVPGFQPEEVVAVLRLARLGIEAEPPSDASLGHD